MDFYKLGDELKYIGTLLETIRNFSKGHSTDYNHAPYDNDMNLLHHLLDEKMQALYDERVSGKGE